MPPVPITAMRIQSSSFRPGEGSAARKLDSLHRTPAGFTVLPVADRTRDILPACPVRLVLPHLQVSVRRLTTLLHASFRQSLRGSAPRLRRGQALALVVLRV